MSPLLLALLLSQAKVVNSGTDLGRPWTLNLNAGATCTASGTGSTREATCTFSGGGGGGAPTTAKYVVQQPDATLSAEQALSLLGTGVLKSTTGTGVLSIAVGADIPTPVGSASALAANPANCPAGEKPTGVAADGSVEGCTAVPSNAPSGASGVLQASNGGGGFTTYGGTGAGPAGEFLASVNGSGVGTWAAVPSASTTLGTVKMAAGCSAGFHVSSIGAGGELTCTADAGGGGGGSFLQPLTVRTFGGF